MRTSAWIAIGLLVLIVACRSGGTSEVAPLSNAGAAPTTPIEVTIDLGAQLRERLSYGLPLYVELRTTTPGLAVGECSLNFDLWEENYRVTLSKTDVAQMKSPTDALRLCVDQNKLYSAQRMAGRSFSKTIVVVEKEPEEPLYKPRGYPEF